MKNEVSEFANQLNRDLARLTTGPTSPLDVVIEETAESAALNPLRNGFNANAGFRLERAREILTRFARSPRDSRSRARDQSTGAEQRQSHEEAEAWRREHPNGAEGSELTDAQKSMLADVLAGGPLHDTEQVSKTAGKIGRDYVSKLLLPDMPARMAMMRIQALSGGKMD